MTKMGQEVTPGKTTPPIELPPARMRRSNHVLDLRQPRPAPQPPSPPGGAEGKVAAPAVAGSDNGHAEEAEERDSVRSRESGPAAAPTTQRDSVRRPAATLPAAPTEERERVRSGESEPAAAPAKKTKKKWWPFGKRKQPPKQARTRLTARQLTMQAFKLAIVLAGAVGFLSLGISLAERFIGIYFVVAVVYAIDSQRTFLVALVFLVMVAIWSALGNSVSAEDYAIYAFYFLVIGLLSAIREMVFAKAQPEA